MSVDEGDESQVDADDISPVRGRRKKRGGKQSTGSRGSKRTKKVEVEIDYAGCEDADTDEYYYEDNYAYEGVSEDLPSHLHDELNDMIDDGTTQSEEQFDKPAETNDSCAQDRRTPPLLKKLTCSKTSGETVLHRAARMGYEDVVLHCLETKRVDINAKDNAGYTPLHESCVRGNLSVAKHLLEFGANVNCSSQDGIRPIHDAVENDHVEIVRLLLSYGADPTLVTYSGKTLNKIARSKAMKTFLEGYFADLKVGDKSTEIHPWEFAGSSSILDPQEEVGYDIFADMPSDSDSDCGYESDIEFEMGDKPHVPCYNIVCEDDHGPCNYVVLYDVLDYLDMKKNDFINFHGNLTFVSLKMSDFAEAIASSVVNNRCKWVTGDMAKSQGYIELVKLDDNLRRIFGTSMERLPKEQPAETQVVELVNAGSVVTPSTSSAPNNMLEPDDMRVSIKKEISDYDEEPVQMETDFTQSGSADVGSPDDDEPPVLYVMCDPAELQRSRFRSPVHPATTEAPDAMMTSFDGLHERGAVFAVKEGTTAEKLSAELPFPPAIRPIIQAKPSEADAICELRIADVCSLAGKGVELFNNSAGALPGMFESQVSENKARRTENGMDEDTDDDMPQLTMCT
ncbi:BCL-6 corepressor-like [Lingula anatina]|uniref:BCL-6 corepressor-like n=1 Tax=Lingula anatina TaxID=7574 RepID=A0A1S3HJF7_LINAN|nr:BCL-6 corepressor-like [Lingula anatina]|eukprot:XP_013386265.1 BCL-6 corepressor-like [Lingula anatina]